MRSRKASHLQGGADRTSDPILTNAVFHTIHVILNLKLGDHEGLTFFIHGQLVQRALLLVLPAILIQIPIRVFLSPIPVYAEASPGLPVAAWQVLAHNSGKLSVGLVCFVLFLILLVLLVLLVKLWWGGQRLIESICHAVYCRPALDGDKSFL